MKRRKETLICNINGSTYTQDERTHIPNISESTLSGKCSQSMA